MQGPHPEWAELVREVAGWGDVKVVVVVVVARKHTVAARCDAMRRSSPTCVKAKMNNPGLPDVPLY